MTIALSAAEERTYVQALAAFDEAEHAALQAHLAEVAQRTRAHALLSCSDEADRALASSILDALEAADVGSVFRVFAVHDGLAQLWMNGAAKAREPAMRDHVIGVLRAAGFVVEMRGSWDLAVRDARRTGGSGT